MARTLTRPRRPAGHPPAAEPPQARGRIGAIDALRGAALCMMFAYHFAFDLRYFGVARLDFENDPLWLGFRAVIVTSFLVLVGVSLVLADRRAASPRAFLRRVGTIAAGAVAATAASYALFPASFIYFGILHHIAAASLIAWPLRRRPGLAMIVGGAILLAGLTLSAPMFDTKPLSWLGFMTHRPVTEDYVPLAPWSAAVFAGIAAGHGLARTGFATLRALESAPRWLRWLGRHSLAVYLLHQPVLIGILWLLVGR